MIVSSFVDDVYVECVLSVEIDKGIAAAAWSTSCGLSTLPVLLLEACETFEKNVTSTVRQCEKVSKARLDDGRFKQQ